MNTELWNLLCSTKNCSVSTNLLAKKNCRSIIRLNERFNELGTGTNVSITDRDQNLNDVAIATVGTEVTNLVQPPTSVGNFIWQQGVSPTDGRWIQQNFPIVYVNGAVATPPASASDEEGTILFTNVITDTHNAYNPLTGEVTIPEDGDYLINFSVQYIVSHSVGPVANYSALNSVQLNGLVDFNSYPKDTVTNSISSGTAGFILKNEATLSLNAGDIIQIYFFYSTNTIGSSINFINASPLLPPLDRFLMPPTLQIRRIY